MALADYYNIIITTFHFYIKKGYIFFSKFEIYRVIYNRNEFRIK